MATDADAPTESMRGVIDAYIPGAQQRIREEIRLTNDKQEALRAFRRDIVEVTPSTHLNADTATPPTSIVSQSSPGPGCDVVFDAFTRHIGPYREESLGDTDAVLSAVADEFSDELAVGLKVAAADGQLPLAVQAELASKVDVRIRELDSVKAALDEERESLDRVHQSLLEIVTWLAEHESTPLTECSFDRLLSLYDRLAEHQERLEAVSEQRQTDIQELTGKPAVKIEHASLIDVAYSDFPVDYPALEDIASVATACTDAQTALERQVARRA